MERWSLDAVLVAGAWGIAVGRTAARDIDLWSILVLILSTWLTYVADRLWDVRPGRPVPQTDRHMYYKCHYKEFFLLWGTLFVGSLVLSWLVLPFWKWAGGLVLVAGIVGYLAVLSCTWKDSTRFFLKRIAVPVIFMAGVGWMSEGWRTPEGLAALFVLLCCAFANLFLISYQESRDSIRPSWLEPALKWSLFGVAVSGTLLVFPFWSVGSGALFCGVLYLGLYSHLMKSKETVSGIRAVVDTILALSAIVILLLGMLPNA
ncbi:hypothetical protein G0Q06_13295 [Puniceicoccales bacterium CK1056]|uniref:UbiA prenyltransferase family protein n=1 Tax=Oceanipulchritudo coccoides TaxID=2706888 RepID=A0A6B2M5Q3_9BACT|nr:hypothetical protein [Oceanipulchritudo coccoides]NDV63434.1 hypothetical protein [Oceanipulchritudo coccoides]